MDLSLPTDVPTLLFMGAIVVLAAIAVWGYWKGGPGGPWEDMS